MSFQAPEVQSVPMPFKVPERIPLGALFKTLSFTLKTVEFVPENHEGFESNVRNPISISCRASSGSGEPIKKLRADTTPLETSVKKLVSRKMSVNTVSPALV